MKNPDKCVNLAGKRFGRLIAVEIIPTDTRKTFWLCQCDCGNTKKVRSDSLQCGAISSCGCLLREQARKNVVQNHKHKMSRTRIYTEWQGMKGRCYNEKSKNYPKWGGRGIKVCDEWLNDFEAFRDWALSNGYSADLTLDRIDNDGDYSPDNCRWATNKEQCNNRRSNIVVKYEGKEYTLYQLCALLELDYGTIHARYARGDRGDDLIRPSGEIKNPSRGAKNNNNKITEETARAIKKDLSSGIKAIEIVRKHEVSKNIVYDIKRGKAWAWL